MTSDYELTAREKLIRAAAYIDTDGCIELTTFAITIRCSFTSVEPTIPEWLKREFGGSIRVDTKPCGKNGGFNNRTAYRWTICAAKAVVFIEQIRPFLMLKHRHADIVIELRKLQVLNFRKIPQGKQQHELYTEYFNEIRQLNRRGKDRG